MALFSLDPTEHYVYTHISFQYRNDLYFRPGGLHVQSRLLSPQTKRLKLFYSGVCVLNHSIILLLLCPVIGDGLELPVPGSES